jgi:hypothetical protein
MTSECTQVRTSFVTNSTTRRFEAPVLGGSVWSILMGDATEKVAHAVKVMYALDRPELGSHWPMVPVPDLRNAEPGSVVELRGGEHLIARILVSHSLEGGANEARTRQLVGRKISQVWALSDGWRGPGSLAPSLAARELYMSAVQVLPPRCLAAAQPTPTADGGIHMEWTRGEWSYAAEIDIDGGLILNVFAPDENEDDERIVEEPKPNDLVDFICRGV